MTTINLADLNGKNGFVISREFNFDVVDSNLQGSGFSVSDAGDINGDGIDDLILGPDIDLYQYGRGKVYIVYGSEEERPDSLSLENLQGTQGFVIESGVPDQNPGLTVSSLGDINGDGIDDIIIGAPRDARSWPYGPVIPAGAGQSYVVFGEREGFGDQLNLSQLDSSNGFVIDSNVVESLVGQSVSDAGDFNGDGLADFLIGAPGIEPNGISYLIFGSEDDFQPSFDLSKIDGQNGVILTGSQSGQNTGASASGAGDINGDGFDDRNVVESLVGQSVSDAGDFNGDGLADFLIGAPGIEPNGISYLIFGSEDDFQPSFDLSKIDGQNGVILTGSQSGQNTGASASGAGDINGDGFDDLIIGAPQALNNPRGDDGIGQAFIVFGSDSPQQSSLSLDNLDGNNGFAVIGKEIGDLSSFSVSSAGDFNGDGFDDLVIGAPRTVRNGRYFAGESYVIYGKTENFDATVNLADLDGTTGFTIIGDETVVTGLGFSVSDAGDINGDGLADLVLGTPDLYYGSSYVLFGQQESTRSMLNLAELQPNQGFRILGDDTFNYGQAGISVSGAGDINGDGIDDVVIGTRGAFFVSDDLSGQSYVVFGNASPEIDLNGRQDGVDFTALFNTGEVAVVDANQLTLNDANSNILVGATVTLTNPLDGASETLAVDLSGTNITAVFDNTTSVLVRP